MMDLNLVALNFFLIIFLSSVGVAKTEGIIVGKAS